MWSESHYIERTLHNSRMAGLKNNCVLSSDGELFFFGDADGDYSARITRCYPNVPQKMTHYFSSRVVQVCVANSYMIFLNNENKIFGCGSNQFGQLGFRNENNAMNIHRIVPQELPIHYIDGEDVRTPIRKISAGSGNTLVLTVTGTVYGCGMFCGRPTVTVDTIDTYDYALCAIPPEVFGHDPVVDVSAGCCVAIFITRSGSVYSVGANSNSEGNHILGLVDVPLLCNSVHIPRRIEYFGGAGVRAMRGTAGRLHSVVIDDQGLLHGWGSNRMAQLGLPGGGDRLPCPIPILGSDGHSSVAETAVTFQQVDCGWHTTLALSTDGVAYSFGSNMYGALGRSDNAAQHQTLLPGKVELERPVAAVYAGGYHSLFLTTEPVVDESSGNADKAFSPVMGRVIATCGLGVNFQLGGGELSVISHNSEGRVIPEIVTLLDVPAPPPVAIAPPAAATVNPAARLVRQAYNRGVEEERRDWAENDQPAKLARGGYSDEDEDVN